MSYRTIGIDDLAAHIPRMYVESSEMERARGLQEGHVTLGLGIKKMAVPDAHEDPMTMGAMAVLKLMRQNNLEPEDIGRLDVATESALDESKGSNSYIVGMLQQIYGPGRFRHCGGVEKKFACASGGIALYDQVNWIRAEENEEKFGIVVVTDIARYELNSRAESTQGAGAVALLVREDPRLLALEHRTTGFLIEDERDFFRPFGRTTAVVDGLYSNLCYLRSMRGGFQAAKEKLISRKIIVPKSGEALTDYIHRMVFHIPYPRMAEYASAFLFRHEWRGLPRWKEITGIIGEDEPVRKEGRSIEALLADKEYLESDNAFRRKFVETPHFKAAFEEKVASSTRIAEQTGNLYSASLPLGLCSTLEEEYRRRHNLVGKRFGLGFYGSGCLVVFMSGIVQEAYSEVSAKLNLTEDLERRTRISMEQYEALHEGRLALEDSIVPPKDEFALSQIGDEPTTEGLRFYTYV